VARRNPFEHNPAAKPDLPNRPDPACLNTVMIDLRKATKGRRMSKKTRKKTGKKSGSASTRKTGVAASKAAAKRTASKPGRSPAAKSGQKSKKSQPKAMSELSSKTSKPAAAKSKRNTAAQSALTEGTKAPPFNLPRDGGNAVSLADYAGQQLVLFFYPRADTPGCTREAIDFTRLLAAFAAAGTAVVGVSGDSQKAQEAFRNKHQLSVPLASDEKHEMLEAYGAWGEKSMYGRTFEGILRTTVLIGADGKIIKIWRNVRVDGHADEVLAAARLAKN
jgi:peroxiredoxin Q/BCP